MTVRDLLARQLEEEMPEGAVSEPAVRPDGRCVECGKQRKLPKSRLHREAAEKDPFCSSLCARAFYGNPLPDRSIWHLNHGQERP